MNRTIKTISTLMVEEVEILGYILTFRHETLEGETAPKEVRVTASKPKPEGASGYAVMPHEVIQLTQKQGESASLQCPTGTPKELIDAMEAECVIILNGE